MVNSEEDLKRKRVRRRSKWLNPVKILPPLKGD